MCEGKNRKNIALIGMSACGKSTIGVMLAKALDMTFVDTDLIIEQKTGKPLWQLLEEVGSQEFIGIESDVICSLTGTNYCISTGGSVVYSDKAMNDLKQIADVVYINLSYSNIKKRLDAMDIRHRGIVMDKGKTLRDVYDERAILYSKYADFTIEADDLSIEELVAHIINLFTKEIK